MALGLPVTAEPRAWIECGTVERDKGDSVGTKVSHEFGIAILKADKKFGSVRLHEITDLADKPLGRVRYVQERMPDIEIGQGYEPGEPQMMHQPIFLDVLQKGFGNRLSLQHQRAVRGRREVVL